jgi:hypothetical protein
MLRLCVFLAAAAAAAGCSDTCTHPGVKVFELKPGDTMQDCSGYGPGLLTPATADECKEAMLATGKMTEEDLDAAFKEGEDDEVNFDVCSSGGITRGSGNGSKFTLSSEDKEFGQLCKCSACPPASSSSTGTGWTLTGIALGAASAGGPIAYGAARAS